MAKTDVIESKAVLRFLQLLCEGHHGKLQNYLRDQPGTGSPINIVNEIMHFLKEVCIDCLLLLHHDLCITLRRCVALSVIWLTLLRRYLSIICASP